MIRKRHAYNNVSYTMSNGEILKILERIIALNGSFAFLSTVFISGSRLKTHYKFKNLQSIICDCVVAYLKCLL
jgi:hypothetical protein